MAKTIIANLAIVPETFHAYVEKKIMERSRLFLSGFVRSAPAEIPNKGKYANAPAFLGFDGDDEVLDDSAALSVNPVGSTNAVSVINFRGKSFGADDLVSELAGADPLRDLGNLYADYWVRYLNRAAYYTLKGAVGGMESAFANQIVNDQSGFAIGSSVSLDTKQLMGEYSDLLDIVIMHSAVRTKLQKDDKTTEGAFDSDDRGLETYLGAQVIVDDTITAVPTGSPTTVDVYDTYFARKGTMLYADGTDPSKSIETDRDILDGSDIVASRKRYIMHATGTSWNTAATLAGKFPSNAELATAVNWGAEDAAEDKKFPVRVLRHKL